MKTTLTSTYIRLAGLLAVVAPIAATNGRFMSDERLKQT